VQGWGLCERWPQGVPFQPVGGHGPWMLWLRAVLQIFSMVAPMH
jgi:hypothetical protein